MIKVERGSGTIGVSPFDGLLNIARHQAGTQASGVARRDDQDQPAEDKGDTSGGRQPWPDRAGWMPT